MPYAIFFRKRAWQKNGDSQILNTVIARNQIKQHNLSCGHLGLLIFAFLKKSIKKNGVLLKKHLSNLPKHQIIQL